MKSKIESNNFLPKIAVILPCYNEEAAISKTVEEFYRFLPNSIVYVFDNNSSDRTAEIARLAGARVFKVSSRGKGNVVRRMFADVEADIYLMADGDATYDAKSAPILISKITDEMYDMVVGSRVDDGDAESYRYGHRFGNFILTETVKRIFGGNFTDMLSGYRAFSRRYVKSFPAHSIGFEIETELTIHALELRMPYCELSTPYYSRLSGSYSKLSTWHDGFKILKTIFQLYTVERPLTFFCFVGFLLILASTVLAIPVIDEYTDTGLVPRLPTAVLSVGLMLSGQLAILCGLVLNNVRRARIELRSLSYLAVPASASNE